MTSSSVSKEKPSIIVKVSKKYENTTLVNDVLFGIEEEGIPSRVLVIDGDDKKTKDLSYEASNESNLGVGVGIANDGISVHYEKLSQNDTLFHIDINSNDDKIRDIGSNAARMVKRMPFKKI